MFNSTASSLTKKKKKSPKCPHAPNPAVLGHIPLSSLVQSLIKATISKQDVLPASY